MSPTPGGPPPKRRTHLIDHYRDLPETSAPTAFRAPAMTAAADSKSSYPKDQAIDCGSNRVSRRNAKWSIAHGGREFDRGHPGGLSVRLDR